MIEVGAGMVAWLGASLVVLADGRRGLAAGIVLAAAGLSVLAWPGGGPAAAGVIALGGLVAAAGRWRSGAEGWQVMPAGSTPRLVLCVAVGLVTLWVAFGITTSSDAALRFAALVSLVLGPARILGTADPNVGLTAAGVLALAMGVAPAAGGGVPDIWPYLVAGLLAAVVAWMPVGRKRAA